MSIEAKIIGGKDSKTADVHQENGNCGVVAYTENLHIREQKTAFAINPTYGIQMAQDLSFGGTPELIHNGTDTVAWTGSNITGSRVTFNSTNRPESGTYSIYMNRPFAGDIWQFDKGSSFDPSAYTAMTMAINVDNNWAPGDSTVMYAFDTGTGLQVGDSVNLADYFNEGEFDVWHELTIPMTDLGVGANTFDTIRMEVSTTSGTRPRWYIDNMNWQESGGDEEFSITPVGRQKFYVDEVNFYFIDAYAGTLADNSYPNLSYNKILNLAKLSNGIVLSRIQGGVSQFAVTVTCLQDILDGGGEIVQVYGDGTNTSLHIKVKFMESIILDPRTEDRISIIISDDLSDLVSFKANARGKTQDL